MEIIKDLRHPYQCARNIVIPVPDSLDILTKIKTKEIERDAIVMKDETNEYFTLMYKFKKIKR